MKGWKVLILVSILGMYIELPGQDKKTWLGTSLQAYPAGLITTILLAKASDLHTVRFRLGGNFTNRKDFSPYNEFEKGNGFGGSAGYRRHLPFKSGYFTIGPSLDIWNMWIHWEENINTIDFESGTSYTFVLQPWVDLGYVFKFENSPLKMEISTGFGREINLITNGEDVGQGWMNSLLLNLYLPITQENK